MKLFNFKPVHKPAATSRIVIRPVPSILLLAVFQVLSATYLLKIKSFESLNSILFFASGLLISLLLLQVPRMKVGRRELRSSCTLTRLAFAVPFLFVSYWASGKIMDATPLQVEYADMLPIMRVMANRFLEGRWTTVYDPISDIWNGIQPIYLPAMWLPFTTSVIWDFDMRWITVCGIWLSILICIWPGRRKLDSLYAVYLVSILILAGWFHFEYTNNVIRLTEEGVVFFYFSLLTVSLFLNNPYLIGVSAALCLLSRYSMIGWVPFAFLYLVDKKEHRFLIQTFAASLLTAFLLLLPFGVKPLLVHLVQHELYVQHAQRIWHQSPGYFYQSLGFAKFFRPVNIRALHLVLLIGTFVVPLLFFVFIRRKNFPANVALLSCFQLCITFFYTFIDVSYLYLYYTPVFVSLAIAGWLLATVDVCAPINVATR